MTRERLGAPTSRSNVIPMVEVFLAVIAWGASFIATKVALQEIQPVTVVWLRFAMGVAILAAAVFARRQFALPQRGEWLYFALLGFIGITFHQWLQSTGLVTAQATTTAWIVATTPIFMALLGLLVLKEGLSALRWAGIGLAGLSAGRFGTSGDLLVLISAPNWAVFSVLSRRGLRSHPAARMMLYVMGFGWLFTSLLFFAGPGLADLGNLTLDGWLGVGFLGVACSGLAYIFWYDALQALPASQAGAFIYLEPLVTVIVAAVVLGEELLWASLLGGAIILLGVWLVQQPQRRV